MDESGSEEQLLALSLRAGILSLRDLAVAALLGCRLCQAELGWEPEERDLNRLVRLVVFVEPKGDFPGADDSIWRPSPIRSERKPYLVLIARLLLSEFPHSSARTELENVVADSSDAEDHASGLAADLGNATYGLAEEVGVATVRQHLATALLPALLNPERAQ